MKDMDRVNFRKYVTIFFAFIFMFLIITPILKPLSISKEKIAYDNDEIFELPDPLELYMSLEEAICRRMSVREFTGEAISNQELSTILWHAYGQIKDDLRSINGITNEYPITLYVLTDSGVWRYNPQAHNLIKYRRFDMTWIGQYDAAAVKIGLVWDKNKCVNENYAAAEIGEICQNIYYTCNALNLGTVTTASEVNQLYFIGLPLNEIPRIIMPIGHPKTPYRFTYNPIISDMPSIKNSSTSLTEAIINRNETIAWDDIDLTLQEQTQVIWSSYGYSYYIDEINNKRHKTIPSSHGTYPLIIHCVNRTGVYEYQSGSHQLIEIKKGDYRESVARSAGGFISSAPLLIIPVLNTTDKNEQYLWPWYYEAAASAYNVMLESTAWNLSSNIIIINDAPSLAYTLELNPNKWLPMFIIPVGKEKNVENKPPSVIIEKPQNWLYINGSMKLKLNRPWIIGPLRAKIKADDDQCFKAVQIYLDGKAFLYSNKKIPRFDLPTQLILRGRELTVKAYDHEGKFSIASIKYYKFL